MVDQLWALSESVLRVSKFWSQQFFYFQYAAKVASRWHGMQWGQMPSRLQSSNVKTCDFFCSCLCSSFQLVCVVSLRLSARGMAATLFPATVAGCNIWIGGRAAAESQRFLQQERIGFVVAAVGCHNRKFKYPIAASDAFKVFYMPIGWEGDGRLR